ncbi:MAG: sulfatase [Coriobacteriia bacterium]|nr:sulfatase [Coriobacteriia bacterium]
MTLNVIRCWGNSRPVLVIGCCAVMLAALAVWRPWLDSVMSTTVVLEADGEGVLVQRVVRSEFQSQGPFPVRDLELDLSSWAGKLVRLDVRGSVRRRGVSGSTGFAGCSAELLLENGTRRLAFVGWREGMGAGLHPCCVGPQSCQVESDPNFSFVTKGTLWHVFKVPEKARLRLEFHPVMSSSLKGVPEACVPPPQRVRLPLASYEKREQPRPPDVFIYVIDALRADHLGCYGYGRNTSPNIDEFTAHATLYHHAHTPATWTRPAMASTLSGLYPSVHGAVHMGDQLAEWPVLLPEILRDAGYVTRCLTANANVTAECGFDQGYTEFKHVPYAPATLLTEMMGRRLRQEEPDQPVFALLHTMEPHAPYTPPAEHRSLFDRGIEAAVDGSADALNSLSYVRPEWSDVDVQHLLDLYDAEIYEADSAFGAFLDMLKSTDRYDHSLIILMSDHGESFGEHDTRAHGFDLNRETMGVMLVVKYPGRRQAGTRIPQPASLIDVLPTALAQVGLRPEIPYQLPGQNLASFTSDAEGRLSRVFAEVSRLDDNAVDLVGVIDEDGFKRVMDVSVAPRETAAQGSLGLWDTREDSQEMVNLVDEFPVRSAYGEQLLAEWLVQQNARLDTRTRSFVPQVEVSPERARELQTLGYVGGSTSN